MDRKHFLGLDGLRGLAAFAVMIMHELGIFNPGGRSIPATLAVDMFFMLSGFVLAFAYGRQLDAGLSWTRFMAIRLIRLYPLLLLGIMVGFALSMVKQHVQGIAIPSEHPFTLLPTLVMVPVGLWYGPDAYPFDGPAWSLFFEILASAAFATRLRNLKGLAGMAFLLAACIALIAIIAWQGSIVFSRPHAFLLNTSRVVAATAIGIVLYRVLQRLSDTSERQGIWQPGMRVSPFAGTLIVFLLLYLPVEHRAAYDLLCIFMGFPLAIWLSCRDSGSPLVDRFHAWIGDLSYPVYILHVPVSRATGFLVKSLLGPVSPPVMIAIATVASIGVSQLALTFYDVPVRRRLSDWLRRQPSRLL